MSNCRTAGEGATHHAGCDCHEAAHRAELEAVRLRAETAEAEVARLTAKLEELARGINLPGWWCLACDTVNERESRSCRRCTLPKRGLT